MDFFRRIPLVFITSAVCLGIGFAYWFDLSVALLAIIAFSLLILFSFLNNPWTIGIFWSAIFCISSGYFELRENQSERLIRQLDSIDEQNVQYRGIVLENQPTQHGRKVTLGNISVESNICLEESFIYHVYAREMPDAFIGDTVSGKGEWSALKGKRNPGDFDFRSFYHRKNILGKIFQDKFVFPGVNTFSGVSILNKMEQIRSYLKDVFNQRVGPPYAGLMSALITGVRSEVDPEIKDHFIATGVVHVLAVSGLHVGYVLLILIIFANLLRIPWGWDRVLIGTGLALFCMLTGGKPSVIRASLMAMLYLLAPVMNRPANIWNMIAAAALFLLMWNPFYLFDMGFQLSFTAVISIVFFYNYFNRVLPERIKVPNISNKPLQFIWGLFLVSLSAQIGTIPFTAVYFGKVPLTALIANVFIVPLIGVLVATGFIIALFSWIPIVGDIAGDAAWFFGRIIDILAAFFANMEFGIIKTGAVQFYQVCIYALGVLALVLIMDKTLRKKGLVVLLISLNMHVWIPIFKKPMMDVIFLDVGQGDAALIRFENGKTMLIDAGQRNRWQDSGSDMIIPALKYFNIEKLDWAVMSHPHSDHIGGFISVMETVKIDSVWDSHLEYGSWTYNQILELITEKNIGYRTVHNSEGMQIDHKTWIQIFAPDTAFTKNQSNVNNASIVMKIIHGKNSFLFTGDLEHEGDDFLLPYNSILQADVLKVGHHGSITSTTEQLLSLIDPDWAIVSVGDKNKFSHPSPIVMERLKKDIPNVLRTDLSQAVWLKSDGERIWQEKWK
ncbi:MAG: DNA internalization-related competence protein ComEC/Rec2 [Candidatus Marinimicrobia bacterium]|nr:DNA internalization-related competence protein ComEC/Rec2 [Candidatus Neomarinimicrobiota bacterium]